MTDLKLGSRNHVAIKRQKWNRVVRLLRLASVTAQTQISLQELTNVLFESTCDAEQVSDTSWDQE